MNDHDLAQQDGIHPDVYETHYNLAGETREEREMTVRHLESQANRYAEQAQLYKEWSPGDAYVKDLFCLAYTRAAREIRSGVLRDGKPHRGAHREESMKDTQDPTTRALETIRAYVRQREKAEPDDGYMSGYDDAMRELEFVLDSSLEVPGHLEQLRGDLSEIRDGAHLDGVNREDG